MRSAGSTTNIKRCSLRPSCACSNSTAGVAAVSPKGSRGPRCPRKSKSNASTKSSSKFSSFTCSAWVRDCPVHAARVGASCSAAATSARLSKHVNIADRRFHHEEICTDGFARDRDGRALRNLVCQRHPCVRYARVLREEAGMLSGRVVLLRRQTQHGRSLHAERGRALNTPVRLM